VALDTVQDYVSQARVLLQDTVQPYRYPDPDLLTALNIGQLEARRERPDLYLTVTSVPAYTAVDSTAVTMDQQYRLPFLYFVVGFAQLRDQEEGQDARAAVFLSKFVSQLTGRA
jgi:hypothetical protein